MINKSTGDSTSIALSGTFDWLYDLDWSPNGNFLLFLTEGQKRYGIWAIGVDGRRQQKIIEDSLKLFSPRWSPKGEAIYYLRNKGQTQDLMKISIVPATGKAKRRPAILLTGLQAGGNFALSGDGRRLLYTRELNFSNLWLVTVEGSGKAQTVKTKPLTTGTAMINDVCVSPNEEQIAFSIGERPTANIFTIPTAGGSMRQMTSFNSFNACPVWSPDGKQIAFGSTQDGAPRVWRVNAEGGTPRPFMRSELSEDAFEITWSPGPRLLYRRPGNRNFHILNPDTEEERALVRHDSAGWFFHAACSPDGKRVAVNGHQRASPVEKFFFALWIISLEDALQTLLYKGTYFPIRWSADGKWIYARKGGTLKIVKIPVEGGEAREVVTLPFKNQPLGDEAYVSMTPDGKRFVCRAYETQSDVWMMENFDPEVK
ncbi:MAG: TolB family protein [bacterium]